MAVWQTGKLENRTFGQQTFGLQVFGQRHLAEVHLANSSLANECFASGHLVNKQSAIRHLDNMLWPTDIWTTMCLVDQTRTL